MKTTFFLPALLAIGLFTTCASAQQLENLASEVAKTIDENRDDVANAAASFANNIEQGTVPMAMPVGAVLDNINSLDTDMIEKTASEIIDKVPATREEARKVAEQFSKATRPAASAPAHTQPKQASKKQAVQSAPNLGSTRPEVSNRTSEPLPSNIASISHLLSGPTPGPEPLKPSYKPATKYDSGSGYHSVTKPDANNAIINSDGMEADRKNNTIIFRGNVILEMQNMELKCDNLIIQLDSNDDPKEVTATGGMVQVKQEVYENGKRILRVAKGRKAVHTFDTEITTLSGGPPTLQNGDQLVETDSEDAVIMMNGKTQKYSIGGPQRVAVPVGAPLPGKTRSKIIVPIGNGKNSLKQIGNLDIRR